MRLRAYEVRVIVILTLVIVTPVFTLTHIRKGPIARSPKAKDIINFISLPGDS